MADSILGMAASSSSSEGQSTSSSDANTGATTNQESSTGQGGQTSSTILGGAFDSNKGQDANINANADNAEAGAKDPNAADPNAQTGDDANKQAGAPEVYEPFNLPEGLEVPQEFADKFLEFARESNLTQEAAQKVIDLSQEAVQLSQQKNLSEYGETIKGWEVESNTYLGQGAERAQKLANIGNFLNHFASPEFIEVLNASGLGSHPETVKFMDKGGAAFSEDKFREGRNMSTPKTDGQLFYPDMK